MLYAQHLAELLRVAGAEVRGYGDYGFRTVDLAVMGFWPVLKKIFYFLRVARVMKRAIREWRPEVVVTIDYPGLNLKLAASAKRLGVPAIHIVCPQVWAWHQNRIPKIAAAVSELLCFLPFEPELFEGTGLDAKFIGHPLLKMVNDVRQTAADEKVVALLPGSRIGEIQRILPRLLAAVKLLGEQEDFKAVFRRLRVKIPAANEGAEQKIRSIVAAMDGLPPIEVQHKNARAVLCHADCAAVASGTATLEAALVRCPTVLVYAVSPILAWFARRVITGVKHVGLVNVVAEKCGFEPPMPELLQDAFTPAAVAEHLKRWLSNEAAAAESAAKLGYARERLASNGDPMAIAAEEILSRCSAGKEAA